MTVTITALAGMDMLDDHTDKSSSAVKYSGAKGRFQRKANNEPASRFRRGALIIDKLEEPAGKGRYLRGVLTIDSLGPVCIPPAKRYQRSELAIDTLAEPACKE